MMITSTTPETEKVPKALEIEQVEAGILLFFNAAYIAVAVYHGFMLYRQKNVAHGKRPLQPNGQAVTHNSFFLFKTSLFVSDCMIMFIYATPKAYWLLNFEWKFGWVMCKLYRYGSSVAFFSNSNIVCGIALDRYLSVYSNHIIGVRQYQRTIKMLAVIWLMAFIAALPQLLVWDTYRPFGKPWEQCVTKFAIRNDQLNASDPEAATVRFHSLLYEGYHQAMSFWLPLSITFGAYARMLSRLIPFWPFSVLNSYEDRQQQTLCTIFWSKIRDKVRNFFCQTILRRNRDSHEQTQSARILLASPPIPGGTRHPPTTALRRQLGTTVFRNACYIICCHIALWLPYNIVSLSRFVDEPLYIKISTNGGNLFEIFILFSSFINPIIYAGSRVNTNIHRV